MCCEELGGEEESGCHPSEDLLSRPYPVGMEEVCGKETAGPA